LQLSPARLFFLTEPERHLEVLNSSDFLNLTMHTSLLTILLAALPHSVVSVGS
jgi:hypothetical protein